MCSHKQALEAEMKKLQESIQQSMGTFNERLMKLFQQKVKTELAVQQVRQSSSLVIMALLQINVDLWCSMIYLPLVYNKYIFFKSL